MTTTAYVHQAGIEVRSYTGRADMQAAHKARQARLWAKQRQQGRVVGFNVRKAADEAPEAIPESLPVERDWLDVTTQTFIDTRRRTTVRAIIDVACGLSGLTRQMITGLSRKHTIIPWRAMICYAASQYSSASSVQIGTIISLDHSTVLYHIKRVETNRAAYEPDLTRLEEAIMREGQANG